jgi:glycosyltransferase involved in cell wall biosynthesis
VIVPQHIQAQKEYAAVGFMNINNERIPSVDCQFPFRKPFRLCDLPEPFDKPDLVVFQETYRIEYLQVASELKKHKVPYVTVPHGELRQEAQHKKRLKKTLANFLFFRRFTDHAVGVHCLSQGEYDHTFFGKKKIIAANGMVIPERQKETFRSQGVNFLYIGRLDCHTKGLDLLVKAIEREADFLREQNCHFKIYGPDLAGRAAHLRKLIENAGVGDLVLQQDAISGAAKEKEILDSDVFIQTSRHEGMPLGILEALSYGLPCLVTQGTNLGETIGREDAGWVADTNVDSIAQQLHQVIQDKEAFSRKGKQAIRLVEKYFSWESIACETLEKYKELIRASSQL